MGILKTGKVNAFFVVLIIMAVLLAGCGSKTTQPVNQSTNQSTDQSPTTSTDAASSKAEAISVNGSNNNIVWQVGDWVYYSNYNEVQGKLYRMKTDGSGRQKLSDDDSRDIKVAGDWVYYLNINGVLYRIKTDGSGRELVQ